jgi:hypothetical protein
MRVSSKLLIVCIGITLIGIGVLLIATRAMPEAPPVPPPPPVVDELDMNETDAGLLSQFTDDQYGASFAYPGGPEGYVVIDAPAEPTIYRFVTLYKKTDWESFQQAVDAREGPVGISYAVMDAGGIADAQTWITQSPLSRFSQGGKLLDATMIGTVPAQRYSYDGLYGAQSVVGIHADRAYVFTVTYIDPIDPQVRDFEALLQSARITTASAENALSQ